MPPSAAKIIVPVYVVHVRAFQIASAGALPDHFGGRELSAGGNVDLTLDNAALAVLVGTVADKIASAVLKEEGGVDAVLIHHDGIRPLSADIIRIHIKVLLGGIVVGHHVESALMETDGGGKYAAGAVDVLQHDLTFSCQHMPDLCPVYQIVAFKERYAGKILKRTAYKIEFAVCGANAGIRVKSLDNGIVISHNCLFPAQTVCAICTLPSIIV